LFFLSVTCLASVPQGILLSSELASVPLFFLSVTCLASVP